MPYRKRKNYIHLLQGKGLEIGGLNSPLPVPDAHILYSDILTPEEIDRLYPGSKHPDIISDSESFPDNETASFDFIIANHVIEHVTNPIGALSEWYRLLKPEGLLYLAVPDRRFTFDKNRQRTRLEHLIDDSMSDLGKRDLNYEHLKEWATHVERLTPDSEKWREWIESEYQKGYSVHNHVWQIEDVFEIFQYLAEKNRVVFELVDHNDTPLFDREFILILRKKEESTVSEINLISQQYRVIQEVYESSHSKESPLMIGAINFLYGVKQIINRTILNR